MYVFENLWIYLTGSLLFSNLVDIMSYTILRTVGKTGDFTHIKLDFTYLKNCFYCDFWTYTVCIP